MTPPVSKRYTLSAAIQTCALEWTVWQRWWKRRQETGLMCLIPFTFSVGGVQTVKNDRAGNRRTSIYYCDPMRSNQKAGIENVHTMLRMILPKGTVFGWLTQWDVRRCVDHINNAPRQCLNGRTPYEVAVKTYGPELLKKLQLRFVAPDEVTLSPKLLRN